MNVFVLHPILFGSLLVALMWNVCAEPIECCVYIKNHTFPNYSCYLWSESDYADGGRRVDNEHARSGPLRYAPTCFHLCIKLRLYQEIRLTIMRMDHF